MEDDRGHPAQAAGQFPGLPKGMRPISQDGLAHLWVGDDGSLYWDGKPIEVRKSLALTVWQRIGAVIAVLAASIGAVAAAVSAWADIAPKCGF